MKYMINIGKNVTTNKPVIMDLQTLISTRLLIQANSGGGKSWLIRRILEQTYGKIQHIVLDLEGEFGTLREKYDYLLVGKESDLDINLKTASLLGKRLLELQLSSIIDLSELKKHERFLYVKRFLDSLINSPKKLWNNVLIIVDEAHNFCPQKSKAESMMSVIDLETRGRKRGQCGALATQRLSKLNKDAGAECNNKLIGRTGLDVDMKRASEELGFTSKKEEKSLRNLKPGEFYCFGPAFETGIHKIKVGNVETTHPSANNRTWKIPKPAKDSKIKDMLNKMSDLALEADKELETLNDYKKELRNARLQISKLTKNKQGEKVITKTIVQNGDSVLLKKIETQIIRLLTLIQSNGAVVPNYRGIVVPKDNKRHTKDNLVYTENRPNLNKGAMRILYDLVKFYPKSITKQQIATFSGFSAKSGTFNTYLSSLRSLGYIENEYNNIIATEEGCKQFDDKPELPKNTDEIISMWCDKIKGGASRILKNLADCYPEQKSKEEIAEEEGFSYSSGTFNTYLSKLKSNGLISYNNGYLKATKELFLE